MELAKHYLLATGTITMDQELETRLSAGLAEAKWPGRCQTIADPSYPSTSWHLDGAHTVESLECCMSWYMSPDVGLTTNAQLSVTLHISLWFFLNVDRQTRWKTCADIQLYQWSCRAVIPGHHIETGCCKRSATWATVEGDGPI